MHVLGAVLMLSVAVASVPCVVFLQPFHTEYQIDSKAELTEDAVRHKLQQIMGTKTNVRSAEEARVESLFCCSERSE